MIDILNRKVDIKSFGVKTKKFTEFSFKETLLSHYNELKGDSKKIARQFFRETIQPLNGFAGLKLEEAIQQYLFEIKADVPFPGPEEGDFTFIDLFAGIGGFRMALQNLGGKCVFSSEWDKYAQQTYKANYG